MYPRSWTDGAEVLGTGAWFDSPWAAVALMILAIGCVLFILVGRSK